MGKKKEENHWINNKNNISTSNELIFFCCKISFHFIFFLNQIKYNDF